MALGIWVGPYVDQRMCHPQITNRNAGILQVVYGDCHFSSSINDHFSSISICENKTVEEGNDLLY